MVLQVVVNVTTSIVPSGYYFHAVIAIATFVVTYAFAQGRVTNRERDLHARTIMITGGFSPLGMTLISSLASRGAHIIAVSQYPLSHPQVTLLIPALRTETKNENIFAEYADLSSPKSIREFCTRFLTGDDQRLDAIILAHEYQGRGSFSQSAVQESKREYGALASFLITTLLLPALLVAPVERDIRVINVVNPFYAAAIPSFTSSLLSSLSPEAEPHPATRSVFVSEGHRALRTVVFARHLQRILNALPNRAPTLDPQGPPGADMPKTQTNPPQAEKTDKKSAPVPSNIISVSVCPGITRAETLSALFGCERTHDPEGYSRKGLLMYWILFPLIWLFAKSSGMGMQSVLHVLFLPTPFKRALAHAYASVDATLAAQEKAAASNESKDEKKIVGDMFTEVVKPGALYRECSVVAFGLPPLPPPPQQTGDKDKEENADQKKVGEASKQKGSNKNSDEGPGEELNIPDDGEYGGESMGRVVWEWYEKKLKTWEDSEKVAEEKDSSEHSKETKTGS
ncbi:hypothetical protein NM688_g3440 [Phlebia brevispora]|uniref:Uncharacterized protein n=1 Tax=Phlebia brevispora TaxID=194682 RepID=A0ACC1T5P0_9APHY|nr:hypothetical protein NM688_g3440 [Phlebia brevispora]